MPYKNRFKKPSKVILPLDLIKINTWADGDIVCNYIIDNLVRGNSGISDMLHDHIAEISLRVEEKLKNMELEIEINAETKEIKSISLIHKDD